MPVPPLASLRPASLHALRTKPESLRVFVCDDDLVFADELLSALTASSFEVRTLRHGRTPVEIFELFAPDIVLLDLFMPPPDGFEMMSHIAQNIRHKHVSLVLMSGADHSQLETATHFCSGRGITPARVLQKPVRLSDILSVCMAHRRRPRTVA
jgi:DNA-binding response OmpR family regulator